MASRVDLEKMRLEYDKFRASVETGADRGKITFRAVASIIENVHLKGTVRGFEMESDEPKERGGTNLAPAPAFLFSYGRGVLTAHPDRAVRAPLRSTARGRKGRRPLHV